MFYLTLQRASLVESILVLLNSMEDVGAVPTFLRMVTCWTLKRRIKNCRSEVPVPVLLFEWAESGRGAFHRSLEGWYG
jgi:hypothetical protein